MTILLSAPQGHSEVHHRYPVYDHYTFRIPRALQDLQNDNKTWSEICCTRTLLKTTLSKVNEKVNGWYSVMYMISSIHYRTGVIFSAQIELYKTFKMIIKHEVKYAVLELFWRPHYRKLMGKTNSWYSVMYMISTIHHWTGVIFFCTNWAFRELQNNSKTYSEICCARTLLNTTLSKVDEKTNGWYTVLAKIIEPPNKFHLY